MCLRQFSRIALFTYWILPAVLAGGEDHRLHRFQRVELTNVYYSEGANAGDLNRDGVADIVHGPFWFAGPDYEARYEIYPSIAQPRDAYADNFFSWVYDFNGDGWNDVFVVGFPGTPAYVYENPTKTEFDRHWRKHQVFDWVSNESPQFVNLVGDDKPELVCTRDGYFGYAAIDWAKPFQAWTFHAVSEQTAPKRFGHGLGIGDVNGDERLDIIMKDGWFAQPESLGDEARWQFHPAQFARAGGAEMYAYDVDGDGDNDVITSLAAHEFGLAWYEQFRDGDKIAFRPHLIMGDRPAQNRYGLVFSELHSVDLADIDGDGLKDIVTGKTYWSHHTKSPLWDAGAVVYWFKLTRDGNSVHWIPYLADAESGIGRQITVCDVNNDNLLDIVVGGMKGASVLLHQCNVVDEATYLAGQPKLYTNKPQENPNDSVFLDGTLRRQVQGAIEGESMKVISVTAGDARGQEMGSFRADRWSDDRQLFWTGAKPGDRLELELPVKNEGVYDVEIVLTRARDYGIVRLLLDDQPLGEPIDLYNSPDVVTTGVLTFAEKRFASGKHRFTIEITGTNPSAVKQHMVGLDYVRLQPVAR